MLHIIDSSESIFVFIAQVHGIYYFKDWSLLIIFIIPSLHWMATIVPPVKYIRLPLDAHRRQNSCQWSSLVAQRRFMNAMDIQKFWAYPKWKWLANSCSKKAERLYDSGRLEVQELFNGYNVLFKHIIFCANTVPPQNWIAANLRKRMFFVTAPQSLWHLWTTKT